MWWNQAINYNGKPSSTPLESERQFFRLVWRMVPGFYGAVLLMTMFFQKDGDNWSSFHLLLLKNAYHLTVLPGFIFAVLLHFIPTDWPLTLHPNEYSPVLPTLLFMIGYCFTLSISTLIWYLIITGGTTVHSIIVNLLSSRFSSWLPSRFTSSFRGVQEHLTEAAVEVTLTRFPLTISILLLALSFATCGALGISLVAVCYLVKLFKIYEDLLEDLLKAKIANLKDNLSPINFHFGCFMLWGLVTALNIPALLHWTRELGSGSAEDTQWDLSMYLCLLLLPTVAILWQEFVPKMEPTIWKLHRYAFYAMGMACALWGTHRLYVTAFLITFVFLTMAICQLVSVMINALLKTTENTPPQEAPPPPSSS
ncbi:GPI inositol-deacylase [Orchesella cincta]|uniref:GPI inositol-deacylase n=1 Tax=Orchesella cincta TaxID=48709 RepID=A0A1D2MIY7_ORCCI|nr:GPI inositol-deacylase [Orchesella cincta]